MPPQQQPLPNNTNALSPPLTPNPDARGDTPTDTNDNENERKRSQQTGTATAYDSASPKRRRVEDVTQNNGFVLGVGFGQPKQGDDTLSSALTDAQAQNLPTTTRQSPVMIQSPNFSHASMAPPPPVSAAALSNRRTSGPPAIMQQATRMSPQLHSQPHPLNTGQQQVQPGMQLELLVRY